MKEGLENRRKMVKTKNKSIRWQSVEGISRGNR